MDPSMMQGPPQGAPPPDMLAALMGGAGAGAGAAPPPDAGGSAGSPSDILREILDLADQYRQVEKSDQNKLMIEQLRTLAQKILANEESDAHDLLQGKASPRALMTHG